jgi:hypothetical protein
MFLFKQKEKRKRKLQCLGHPLFGGKKAPPGHMCTLKQTVLLCTSSLLLSSVFPLFFPLFSTQRHILTKYIKVSSRD